MEKYCRWSSQKLNVEKSSIIFSKNCDFEIRRSMCHCLYKKEYKEGLKYLGNSLVIGRSQVASFAYLKKISFDQLDEWMAKEISKSVRTTLAK